MAKIVFVEDDIDIINSYKVILKNKGHEIIPVNNAFELIIKKNLT